MYISVWLLSITTLLLAAVAYAAARRLRRVERSDRAIRKKYNDLVDAAKRAQPQQADAPESAAEVRLIDASDKNPIAVLVGSSEACWDRAKPLRLSDGRLSGLNGLVEHLPAAGLGGLVASHTLFELSFSSEAAMRLAIGSLNLPGAPDGGIKAIAVDTTTHRIFEHGTLSASNGMQVAGFATAAWAVLASVVGKKYLVHITEKLDRLARDTHSIQGLLESEMSGWLIGQIETLRRYAQELQGDTVRPGYAQELFKECMRCSSDSRNRWHALRLQYEQTLLEINGLTSGDRMTEQAVRKAPAALENLRSKTIGLEMATRIRAGAETLRASLGFSTPEGADELERLTHSVEKLDEQRRAALEQLMRKIPNGNRPIMFDRDEFDLAQRAAAEAARVALAARDESASYCRQAAASIRKSLEASAPVRIVFKRSASGSIEEARLVQ